MTLQVADAKMASRADDEKAPLIPGGMQHRDYQGRQQNNKKNGDSPLLPMLNEPNIQDDYDGSSLFQSDIKVSGVETPKFGRTRPASDAVSVTSFGGNLTTSVANEGDIQNLQDVLNSLEKASVLIRNYMHQEQRMMKK